MNLVKKIEQYDENNGSCINFYYYNKVNIVPFQISTYNVLNALNEKKINDNPLKGLFSEIIYIKNGNPNLKEKLNELRKLVFPDENLVKIDLGNKQYSPLVFRPKIISFSLD
mgnify:CR=1 FL=1